MPRQPLDELALLHDATAGDIQRALARVVRFRNVPQELEAATFALGRLLARINAAADLLGRRRMLFEARAVGIKFSARGRVAGQTGREMTPHLGPRGWGSSGAGSNAGASRFAATDFPFGGAVAGTDVPFLEAVMSLLNREPILAPGWEAARDAYEAGGFALAQAAAERTSANVQAAVASAVAHGTSALEAEAGIRAAAAAGEGFTAAYSETVLRTNVTGAYAAGRRAQARSPAIRAAAPAFRFVATGGNSGDAPGGPGDGATRKNHLAAHNMIAHVDDSRVWNLMSPPLGFNCRCALELVPRAEARKAGVVEDGQPVFLTALPPGARPDVGFKALG